MTFVPRLDVLPQAQRALWPELAEVPRHFVLYGGTGLALRLGHRASVDFDFFSSRPFQPMQLRGELRCLTDGTVLDSRANTLTVLVNRGGPVKLSFFGSLSLGRVRDPEPTQDEVLQVASQLDLAAAKMRVIWERCEVRDYLDVHALLQAGVSLPAALGAARAVSGGDFNPTVTLRALSYFRDGDLPSLPEETKQALAQAAGATTVGSLEDFSCLPGGLAPGGDVPRCAS